MSSRPLVLLLALPLLLRLGCFAERHPEVLVVVNRESPISLAIGEYYLEQRGIPASRLVQLSIPLTDPSLGDPAQESISREEFERRIRDPLAAVLRERELVDSIEIIVTTKGIPLKVEGPRIPVETLLRDSTAASVDAELCLLFSPLIGSPGIVGSLNPYYDGRRSFREHRRRHPDSPLHYMVARLTGYQSELDAKSGVPRDIKAMIDAALLPTSPRPLWLIDLNPTLEAGMDAGNRVLLEPAAAGLEALGLRLKRGDTAEFVGNIDDIQGYASWGSNDGNDPAPSTYGEIDGRSYPGHFAPRALAMDFVSTNARSFTHPPHYGQSLVADLIGAGAAGCSGHVDEPTLPAVARPHIMLRRYAQGVPAVEAFYRSIPYLGWMNVYVGDPLMRLDEPAAARDPADLDGDGFSNRHDNCSTIPNRRQRDSDGDGYGNICDADVNHDGLVTTSWGEVYPLGRRGDVEWIALTAQNGPYDPNHDLDGDGQVDARDISIAQLSLFMKPGPSRSP